MPFITYSIVFIILRNYFVNINILEDSMRINYHNIPYYVKNILFFSLNDPLLGAFWFLVTILYVSIIYLIINLILKIFRKNNIKNLTFVVFFISLSAFLLWQKGIDIGKIINPNDRGILRVVQYFFDTKTLIILSIYHMGYLYNKYEKNIKMDIRVVLLFLLVIIFYFNDGIYIDISANMYNNPLYFYFAAIIGIYINLYFAKKISNLNIRLLEYIGTKSIYIMIFHLIAFKVVNYIQIKFYNLSMDNLSAYPTLIMRWGDNWWMVYTIVGVFLPILIVFIIDKIKVIKSRFCEKGK